MRVFPPPDSPEEGLAPPRFPSTHRSISGKSVPGAAVRVRLAVVVVQGVHSPSDSIGSALSGEPGRSTRGVPAVLLVSNPDTRLLLKGLLRLQRHPVLFEAAQLEELDRLSSTPGPKILLVDVEPEDGDWAKDVRAALQRHPDLRPILITPQRTPEVEARAAAAGIRTIVIRPFAIRDLIGAVEAVSAEVDLPSAR